MGLEDNGEKSSTVKPSSVGEPEPNEHEPEIERIYIGGLHPPYLTVPEFTNRLVESLGSVIDILPDDNPRPIDDDEACYVHLNVRRRKCTVTTSSDDNTTKSNKTALEQVAKLYHNVTWKGCKLRVEAAKPHFLEKLHHEIQERQERRTEQQQQQQQQHANAVEEGQNQHEQLPVCQRRHLKIRERYGEQVFSVDTKPYKVDDWKNFEGLRRKIDKRRQHYLTQKDEGATKAVTQYQSKKAAADKHNNPAPLDIRTQSKLNRAVHLRLAKEDSDEDNEEQKDLQQHNNAQINATGDAITHEASDDSSSSLMDDSSTSSDVDSGSENDQQKPNEAVPKSTYVWSSSDNDGDSSSDEDGEGEAIAKQNAQKKDNNEQSADSKQVQNAIAPKAEPQTQNSTASETSSDDDSDSGSSSETSRDGTDMEEEMAWKAAPSTKDNNHDSKFGSGSDDDDEEGPGESSGVLKEDVESNLDILSSLFPDIKKSKPRKVASDTNTAEELKVKGKTDGWSAGGTMLRYDPTKDPAPPNVLPKSPTSSKKAVSEEKKDRNDTSSESESEPELEAGEGSDADSETETSEPPDDKPNMENKKTEKSEGKDANSGSDSAEAGNEKPGEKKHDKKSGTIKEVDKSPKSHSINDTEGNLYKQDKLEDLFREARKAAGSSAPVVVHEEREAVPTLGGFSFGFDLGGDQKIVEPETETQANSGFSFSFFPKQAEEEAEQGTSTPAEPTNKMDIDKDDATRGASSDKTSMHANNDIKPDIPRFRRRGMVFPKEVLDRYQEDFYTMNDGLKILQDLERYHNDKEVKEHWHQERQTLTQDWKRKRKYAQQARNKHQKTAKHHHRS